MEMDRHSQRGLMTAYEAAAKSEWRLAGSEAIPTWPILTGKEIIGCSATCSGLQPAAHILPHVFTFSSISFQLLRLQLRHCSLPHPFCPPLTTADLLCPRSRTVRSTETPASVSWANLPPTGLARAKFRVASPGPH